MNFKEWLISEQNSGVLLAKAVDKAGYESISKNGFQLQQKHNRTDISYGKYKEMDVDQSYGPGLYFSFVNSPEKAKSDCARYKDYGDHVVLANIPRVCKILITYWFPESHPIWQLSPLGKQGGIYDQLVALGIQNQFPDFKQGDTSVDNEWGYKLSKLIDAWVHQHNMNPHIVVYNTEIIQFAGGFACEIQQSSIQQSSNQTNSNLQKTTPNTNPATGRPFDKNIPLSKQTRLGGLDSLIQHVHQVQQNPKHPEYPYWKDYTLFPKRQTPNTSSNLNDLGNLADQFK